MIKYRRDLWKLIEDVPGDTAEIGVAEGYFSRDILAWDQTLKPRRHYMVDRWQYAPVKGDSSNPQSWHDANYAAALERVKPFGDRAIILQGDSIDMAKRVPDRSLALLYIDGDHSFDGVMADLFSWYYKLVRPGGVIAFHDYLNPAYGVKAAVTEYAKMRRHKVVVIPEDKMEDAGAYFVC